MGIVFPCSDTGHSFGVPKMASACGCPNGGVGADPEAGCVFCGHWLEDTIARTFERQAQLMSRRSEKKAGKLFMAKAAEAVAA